MIPLFPLLVVSGIGAIIYSAMHKRTEAVQNTWSSARGQVKRSIEEQQAELDRYYADKKNHLNFRELCNLHYCSHCVANEVHQQLKTPRLLLAEINKTLAELKQQKELLEQKLKLSSSNVAINRIKNDLKSIIIVRKNSFTQRDQLQQEIAEILTLQKKLNADTSELKYRIRDTCGSRGEEWFNRLEQRINARHKSYS
tara:strand:- start:81 stop:674 length:594 start_codon:yes stop_codon:yes gene_type:complete